jgi:hypothetical protein
MMYLGRTHGMRRSIVIVGKLHCLLIVSVAWIAALFLRTIVSI